MSVYYMMLDLSYFKTALLLLIRDHQGEEKEAIVMDQGPIV